MSGGGYYRFPCKYFYTHNCQSWVYVNGTACAECSAKGRDTEPAPSQTPTMDTLKEICVPRVEEGVMYYTLMEVQVESTDTAGNSYWAVKEDTTEKQTQQPQAPPTTSALPGTPMTAFFFG